MPIARVGEGQTAVDCEIAHRASEGFELEADVLDAGRNLSGARTGARIIVRVGAAEIVAGAVDVLDDEVEAVEGIELEVAEHLMEDGEVHVDPVPVIFGPGFERIIDLGLELEIRAGRDETMAIRLTDNGADRAAAR